MFLMIKGEIILSERGLFLSTLSSKTTIKSNERDWVERIRWPRTSVAKISGSDLR